MSENKISRGIFDARADNLAKLAALFPSAVKDGQLDINALREELGDFEDVGSERFELIWAGKQAAKKLAQEDIAGRTLKFVPQDSKDADTTQNLYIEGDNLEVLKLLRRNYYGAVKMIYIDPPYNTGNDFVYRDNFVQSRAASDEAEGETVDGERMVVNQRSSNRYHANWLNMMWPRLRVAKDCLAEQGIIFISIDENEFSNLRKISDEIFGHHNFLTAITVKLRHENRILKGDKDIHEVVEYCLAYKKSSDYVQTKRTEDNTSLEEYVYQIEELSPPHDTIQWGGKDVQVFLPGQYKLTKTAPGVDNFKRISIRGSLKEGNSSGRFYMSYLDGIKDAYDCLYKVPDIGDDKYSHRYFVRPASEKIVNGAYFQGVPINRADIKEIPFPNFVDMVDEFNRVGYEGDVEFRNGKKPLAFIRHLMKLAGLENDKNCICMDFFSGSATTAHALMQLNAEDGGNRKFICVQYPEDLDAALKTADNNARVSILATIAFLDKINKPHFITEIGKERIRRAGEKITGGVDVGFKVFRTADTNIRWTHLALTNDELYPDENMLSDRDRLDFMEGYTDIDVAYEILLRQRDIPLSAKVKKLGIGKRIYMFADAYVVCLDDAVTQELLEALAAIEPTPIKYVLRDSAFGEDISLKDESMRRLSAYIARNSGEGKRAYTVEFL